MQLSNLKLYKLFKLSNFSNFMLELTQKEDLQEFPQDQLTIEKDNLKLIIESINAQKKNNDALEITDFKAILLMK